MLQPNHLVRRRGRANSDPIKIVFSARVFKETSNILYRRIMNEDELVLAVRNDPILKSKHNINIELIDFGTLGGIEEQIKKIYQDTDILIGAHGAGLTHSLWLPEEAAVIELFPSNFHSSFFRNMAKWRGLAYYAIQNDKPENVVDAQKLWTKIDPTEFVRVVQAAVMLVEHHHLGTGTQIVEFDLINENHHL